MTSSKSSDSSNDVPPNEVDAAGTSATDSSSTSSPSSLPPSLPPSLPSTPLSPLTETCPKCGGPVRERPARPFPVALQLLFGASFALFLIFYSRLAEIKWAIWAWTAAQIVLGVFLMRARKKSHQRILICIRCKAQLP